MGICAIWGAPRSGKTSLALNLAYAASRRGKSVCLISPTEYSELSSLLNIKISKSHCLQSALSGKENIRQSVFKADDLLYVLASPVSADAFDDNYSSEQVKSLLDAAKLTFDLVIVDCPSETNNLIAAWSLNMADIVLLCLGGHISCALWYETQKRALQAMQNKASFVCTQLTSDLDYEAMFTYMKCTPIVKIPYVSEASILQNERTLLYQLSGKKGKSYVKAINKLLEVIKI